MKIAKKNENRRYIFAISIFKNDLVPLIKNKLEIFKGFVSSFGFDEQLRVFLSSSLMCLYFALSVRHHVVFYLFFIHSLVTLFFTLLSFDGADKKELKTQSRTVSVEIDFSHDHLLITFSSFEMGQLSSRSLVWLFCWKRKGTLVLSADRWKINIPSFDFQYLSSISGRWFFFVWSMAAISNSCLLALIHWLFFCFCLFSQAPFSAVEETKQIRDARLFLSARRVRFRDVFLSSSSSSSSFSCWCVRSVFFPFLYTLTRFQWWPASSLCAVVISLPHFLIRPFLITRSNTTPSPPPTPLSHPLTLQEGGGGLRGWWICKWAGSVKETCPNTSGHVRARPGTSGHIRVPPPPHPPHPTTHSPRFRRNNRTAVEETGGKDQ